MLTTFPGFFAAMARITSAPCVPMRREVSTSASVIAPARAYARAGAITEADVETSRRIGLHGAEVIRAIAAKKAGKVVDILTHCNAGWLAAVDWGTALAPVYAAHREGISLHVWVDETRPRNQGASLTAFELAGEGVPHTVIADNAGGHLMQEGRVD